MLFRIQAENTAHLPARQGFEQLHGGSGEIRTRVSLSTPKVFETWPFNHSDTLPTNYSDTSHVSAVN